MGSTQQTSNVFSIFCQSEKKVYFRPFLSCFYVYFGVLRVNIGGFECFHQYGACSRSKKHKFQTKLDVENFRSILFWSENVNSGVKLDVLNLFNSQSNQNKSHVFTLQQKSYVPNQKSTQQHRYSQNVQNRPFFQILKRGYSHSGVTI